VKRFPSILTFRAETAATKLVQLDCVLSGVSIENSTIGFDVKSVPGKEANALAESDFIQVQVSDMTLGIARRVPELLGSDIPGTLFTRAIALRSLLFEGENVIDRPRRDDEDQAFARVLKRCPELLLYNIDATVAPKVNQLNVRGMRSESAVLASSSHLVAFVISIFKSLLAASNDSFVDENLPSSTSNRELGTRIALREPRLLLYDINESLLPKVRSEM
jgi:hypothetical protein